MASIDDVQANAKDFNLILLMGNGVGIYGNEGNVRASLKQIYQMLCPGGALLGEGMPMNGMPFTLANFIISYNGQNDPQFQWGFCSCDWLAQVLTEIGFVDIQHYPINLAHAPGAYLFVAKKPMPPIPVEDDPETMLKHLVNHIPPE